MNTHNESLSSSRSWIARNWKWAIGLSLAVLLLSRFTLHFGYFEEDKSMAAKLIEQFHARVNAGQFDQIYGDAHETFKRSGDRDSLVRAMQETRDRLGAFKEVSASEVNVIAGSPVQVRAACNSTFEKGDATELFAFIREGHKLQLVLYQVSPGTVKLEGAEDLQAAQKSAEEFYGRMSAGEYDAIYDGMADDLKRTTSQEEMRSFFKGVNDKFGNCGTATLVDTDYAKKDKGHFVGLKYTRKCMHGDLNDRLAFTIVDGKALLRGYH